MDPGSIVRRARFGFSEVPLKTGLLTTPPYHQNFDLDFANPLQTDNVLTDFDFDTFLQDGNGAEEGGFDFSSGFSMEPDATIGAAD